MAKIPPALLANARRLRKDQTDVEALLWGFLRGRRFRELKWRRQVEKEGFILDFYCSELNLAVELDGGQHNEPAKIRGDEKRSRLLREKGITVLRFWNNEVLENLEGVLTVLWEKVDELGPPAG